MEYVTYILITLGIMALCLFLFGRKDSLTGTYGGNRRLAVPLKSESAEKPIEAVLTSDERLSVPTPWGWPGNDSGARDAEELSVSETLHRFVDHLVAEKQTVEDQEYLLKRNASLRALVEDRYGVSRATANGSDPDGSKKESADLAGSTIVVDRSSLREVRTPWGW